MTSIASTNGSPGRRIARAISRAAASLGVAGAILAVTAGSTLAYGNNGPDLILNGYGVTVMASVSCDAGNGTMTVSASATTMQAEGALGPILGPYDAGQWLRYNVSAREIGTSAWKPVFTWSDWEWIVSVHGNGDFVISAPTDLGSDVMNGTPGHNFEILVQVDYWTGVDNIVNVTPSYGQTLSIPARGSYFLEPGYCHL